MAVESATFALPETRIGAYPPFAVERLATVGEKKRGMELILTGEPIDAETASDWGIINCVVAQAELEDTVMEHVDNIVRSPEGSTRLAKQYARSGERGTGDPVLIAEALAPTSISRDCQEATRAFLQRNEGSKDE